MDHTKLSHSVSLSENYSRFDQVRIFNAIKKVDMHPNILSGYFNTFLLLTLQKDDKLGKVTLGQRPMPYGQNILHGIA